VQQLHSGQSARTFDVTKPRRTTHGPESLAIRPSPHTTTAGLLCYTRPANVSSVTSRISNLGSPSLEASHDNRLSDFGTARICTFNGCSSGACKLSSATRSRNTSWIAATVAAIMLTNHRPQRVTWAVPTVDPVNLEELNNPAAGSGIHHA
jgi:hypothetical protein